jgi:hypothetical protein
MNLQNFPSGSPFTVDISGRARPNVTDSSTKFELPINKNSHLATGDGGTTDGGKEDGTAVDDPNVAVTVGYSVGGPVFEITVEGKASGFWLAAGKAIAEALNSRFPSKESPSGGYTATWLRPSPFGR